MTGVLKPAPPYISAATACCGAATGWMVGVVESDDLMKAFYRAHDFSDITVLDPFMGSGSTAVAALRHGLEEVVRRPEPLERLTIVNPGDANATVVAVFEEPHGLSHEHPQIAFDGVSEVVALVEHGHGAS